MVASQVADACWAAATSLVKREAGVVVWFVLTSTHEREERSWL